jgi:tetratricopeptide (TPR) repeat protein
VVQEREIQSALENARGDKLAAVSLAGEACALEGEMPFSFGPPFVDLPSAEYLGELLLAAQKYEEAADAFENQLERSRQKANALQGLAQAQSGIGREAEARYTREKLDRIRAGADESVKRSD